MAAKKKDSIDDLAAMVKKVNEPFEQFRKVWEPLERLRQMQKPYDALAKALKPEYDFIKEQRKMGELVKRAMGPAIDTKLLEKALGKNALKPPGEREEDPTEEKGGAARKLAEEVARLQAQSPTSLTLGELVSSVAMVHARLDAVEQAINTLSETIVYLAGKRNAPPPIPKKRKGPAN
jgi:hypothetical protein